jgi:hypothetical protein
MTEYYNLGPSHTNLNSKSNHSDYQNWDHPMSHEFHCWLYHSLYDHEHLSWKQILTIGIIWVDLELQLQHWY